MTTPIMRRHLTLSSALIRLAKLSLCAVLVATAGCATSWKPRSKTQATIYAEASEIPVLWADSTFVDAVDGVAAEKGKGYVLVEPGRRSLTIFHVNCPLPIVVVFCLKSARRRQIESEVAAGAAYRIGWEDLYEVAPNGQKREATANNSSWLKPAPETSESCDSQACELTKSLSALNLADPVADLERNTRSGDWKFIGICSYSCAAFGVEGAVEPRAASFGIRSLRGTSCIVEDDTHLALLEQARNYARVYNTELLRRIRGRSTPQSLGASG